MVWDKYSEMKILGYFFRAARGLTRVELAGNGTTNYTTNSENVFAQGVRNIDDESMFYVIENANTSLTTREEFKLNMSTSVGTVQVPQYAPDIVIDGRQAKILVTDFPAGDQHLIYSTAEILAVSAHESTILAFWVPTGESGEFYLRGATTGHVMASTGGSDIHIIPADEGVIVVFTQEEGMTVLQFDNGARAVIVDRSVAYKTWQPMLTNDPHAPLDQTLLVRGPGLVRTAAFEGRAVNLTGDYDLGDMELEVFANGANSSTTVTFNGKDIPVRLTNYGSLLGSITPNTTSIPQIEASLPLLTTWKAAHGLPERLPNYTASAPAWVRANQTSTLNPWQPETFPVLYADAYGFHAQNILWRATFPASTPATAVFLKVFGGTASGFSAWLNGHYLGSALGTAAAADEITNATLPFPPTAPHAADGADNILLVLQDHSGHGQTEKAIDPRGILNATLVGGGDFSSWHVAGKAGGQANLDPIRGPYNEGGLYAERLGWHLPGFDDGDWVDASPQMGFEGGDVMFYRTVVPLDLPRGYDYSLAFELDAPEGAELRAQLYVNGYMFGKFVPHIGNQVSFPVFPGILDYHGDNTVGLSVWAQSEEGAKMGVRLSVQGMLVSSLEASEGTEYLRPGWSEERLVFA